MSRPGTRTRRFRRVERRPPSSSLSFFPALPEFLRDICALPLPPAPGLAVPSRAPALTAAGQPWSKAKGPRRRNRLRRNATSASPSGPWRRPAPPSCPPSSSIPSTSPRYAGDPVVASISSREENLVGWVPNDSSLPTWFVKNWVDWILLLLFCLWAWNIYGYWCSFGPRFLFQTRLQAQAAGVVYNPVSLAHNSMDDDISASNAEAFLQRKIRENCSTSLLKLFPFPFELNYVVHNCKLKSDKKKGLFGSIQQYWTLEQYLPYQFWWLK